MNRENGHPDFEYSRRKFRQLDMEEKKRNELIKLALDRMNHYYADVEIPEKPTDSEADRKKRVEVLLREERELNEPQKEDVKSSETITTFGNFHGYRFVVPREVYSNEQYREYLNYAKTEKSVREIIDEYYRKYPKRKSTHEGQFHYEKKELEYRDIGKPKRHFHIRAANLTVSVLVLLAGLGLFLYSSRDVYLIFIIPFVPIPIPFWIVGIGLTLLGTLGFIASIERR